MIINIIIIKITFEREGGQFLFCAAWFSTFKYSLNSFVFSLISLSMFSGIFILFDFTLLSQIYIYIYGDLGIGEWVFWDMS